MTRSSVLAAGCAIVVAVLLLAGVSRVVAADNPRLGTWKVNLAKSTYDPGPAPKSVTRTYEVFEGDGVKYTQVTVNADGSVTTLSYSAHEDGKEYPFKGNVNADTIETKRIDAYTNENTLKKAGKVVQMTRSVISKDGKTLTLTQKSPPNAARKVNNVLVHDKQ